MREHKQAGAQELDRSQDDTAPENLHSEKAMLAIGYTRRFLNERARLAANAMMVGSTLFQVAVRGIEEKKLQEKLDASTAESLKERMIDKLWDKFKEGLTDAADLGKSVIDHSSEAFSAIKGQISDHIQNKKELTVLELADAVTAAMVDKSILLERNIEQAVRDLPARRLLAIRQSMALLQGAKSPDDSEENGFIADGIRDEFLEKLGMPRGDMVASELYAISAFAEFQMGLISTMPAHEAGPEIQKRLANPNSDTEAIDGAEEKMGERFNKKLEKDRNMRLRVQTEAS